MHGNYWKSLVGFVATLVPLMNAPLALADSWTFTVTNEGKSTIERIEAAEEGDNEWRRFVNSEIAPGETSTFEWDASTENTSCSWKLRAIYADGPSEAATFNFCESTNLVFDN